MRLRYALPLLSLPLLAYTSPAPAPAPAHHSSSSSASSGSVNGGGSGDPGVYPGGSDAANTGWRSLPPVTGAKIDNTTVKVASGATLTTYLTDNFDASQIKRAVIQIHGENRDSWNQWLYASNALDRAVQGGEVKRSEVVIMAPQFFDSIDHGAYPSDDLNVSNTEALIWNGGDWGAGLNAVMPSNADAGSMDALDAASAYFLDTNTFPNLVTLVIAGFSMGGQLVQRYTAFRTSTAEDARIHFWICSPGSFVYFNSTRPGSTSKCKNYNKYKYGLDGSLPRYVSTADANVETLVPRYLSRTANYMVGLDDHIAGDPRCEAKAQGKDHVIKMQNWVERVVPYLPGASGSLPPNSTIDYVSGVGHVDYRMIGSDPGVQRLFLDDYSAKGSSAKAPPSNGDSAGSPKALKDAAIPGAAPPILALTICSLALTALLASL